MNEEAGFEAAPNEKPDDGCCCCEDDAPNPPNVDPLVGAVPPSGLEADWNPPVDVPNPLDVACAG